MNRSAHTALHSAQLELKTLLFCEFINIKNSNITSTNQNLMDYCHSERFHSCATLKSSGDNCLASETKQQLLRSEVCIEIGVQSMWKYFIISSNVRDYRELFVIFFSCHFLVHSFFPSFSLSPNHRCWVHVMWPTLLYCWFIVSILYPQRKQNETWWMHQLHLSRHNLNIRIDPPMQVHTMIQIHDEKTMGAQRSCDGETC